MEFGAIFPTCEIGSDPAAIRDWAQAAEGLGYAHIVAYDHVLGAEHADREPPLPGPYTEAHPFHEPFVLFGFLAGVTQTIAFETGVLVLPQRPAVLVAKQAAEVDVLSGGRLRLGVGTGWNRIEYESLGADHGRRGRMLDEQVEVIRSLWEDDVVDFSGDFHRIDRAGMLPRPPHRIPIWFGGFSKVAVRRAARIGDGFTFNNAGAKTLEQAELLRNAVADAGRDPAAFPIELTIPWSFGADACAEQVARAGAASISHMCVNTMAPASDPAGPPPPSPRRVAEHIAALEQFMAAVR